MSKVFKPRRGSANQVAAFVGEANEVILNTTTNTLHVMDGLTAGGFPLAKEADLNTFKTAQSTRDAEQDAAISAALISAVIEGGELVLTYGNGTIKRESLPGGLPLGTLMPYTGKDVPAGFLRADGATYTNMRTAFPEFYEWVVNSGLTVPLADYALVEGSCGYYGLDTSTGTVRMPTLAAGVFGTTAAGQYGQAAQAGLPNITGKADGVQGYHPTASGAFSVDIGSMASWSGTASGIASYAFNASRCSSVYRDDIDTVQPPHVKYPWVISVYNAAVPPSVAQAGEFVGLLDGKADKEQVASAETINAEGRARIVGWGMPDYSAGVEVTFPYTVPQDGIVAIGAHKAATGTYYMYINDMPVTGNYNSANTYYTCISGEFLVSKGDVISTDTQWVYRVKTFYPFKGVN